MNIGEAARQSDLPAKTIRYYEDIGLVDSERQSNGYRSYNERHIHMLRFVQRARGLGFSIEDCRSLLSLYQDRNRASADVKRLALARLAEIERKIAELHSMKDTLGHLVERCHGDDRPDCPIIDDLSGSSGRD